MGEVMTIGRLLYKAKKAGLRLRVEGGLLKIRGDKDHAALAEALLDRKRDVVKILTAGKSSCASSEGWRVQWEPIPPR